VFFRIIGYIFLASNVFNLIFAIVRDTGPEHSALSKLSIIIFSIIYIWWAVQVLFGSPL
jgi:hypothetical protein